MTTRLFEIDVDGEPGGVHVTVSSYNDPEAARTLRDRIVEMLREDSERTAAHVAHLSGMR